MTTATPRDENAGTSASPQQPDPLGLALLRLLVRGRPVRLEELAASSGRTPGHVTTTLATQPDIEYDDAGDIIGSGITLRPTPYEFELDGHRTYTWCALDTLVFPTLLDRPAHVTSACHATGTPIHVDVAPGHITSVHPTQAVVSLVNCTDNTAIRATFCDHIHFFASTQAAQPWLADHPAAWLSPIPEAQVAGRKMITALPLARQADGCCAPGDQES